MAWDIALDPLHHELNGKIVTGDDEIIQRLWVRLNKELGEWFLNVDSGVPWYQEGYGILGAKPNRKNDIDLILRNTIGGTVGIKQVLYFRSLYASGTRAYTLNTKVQLQSGEERTFDVVVNMNENTIIVEAR